MSLRKVISKLNLENEEQVFDNDQELYTDLKEDLLDIVAEGEEKAEALEEAETLQEDVNGTIQEIEAKLEDTEAEVTPEDVAVAVEALKNYIKLSGYESSFTISRESVSNDPRQALSDVKLELEGLGSWLQNIIENIWLGTFDKYRDLWANAALLFKNIDGNIRSFKQILSRGKIDKEKLARYSKDLSGDSGVIYDISSKGKGSVLIDNVDTFIVNMKKCFKDGVDVTKGVKPYIPAEVSTESSKIADKYKDEIHTAVALGVYGYKDAYQLTLMSEAVPGGNFDSFKASLKDSIFAAFNKTRILKVDYLHPSKANIALTENDVKAILSDFEKFNDSLERLISKHHLDKAVLAEVGARLAPRAADAILPGMGLAAEMFVRYMASDVEDKDERVKDRFLRSMVLRYSNALATLSFVLGRALYDYNRFVNKVFSIAAKSID